MVVIGLSYEPSIACVSFTLVPAPAPALSRLTSPDKAKDLQTSAHVAGVIDHSMYE